MQAPYAPTIMGDTPAGKGLVAPQALMAAMDAALTDLVGEVGALDAYLVREVGFADTAAVAKALDPHQQHSVALAIRNHQKGLATILADGTGAGKGRQVAALIRYAEKRGLVPVFVTEKESLFSRMLEDQVNVGMTDVRPFITNNGAKVFKPGTEEVLYHQRDDAARDAALTHVTRTGKLPAGTTQMWTTYTQMNKDDSPVVKALAAIGEKGFIVMDEAHNAAGDSTTGRNLTSVVRRMNGTVYASATYAKSPAHLALYSRTSLGVTPDLAELLTIGGAALQGYTSQQLARGGQLVRRERSQEGVEQVVTVSDRPGQAELTERVTELLSQLIDSESAVTDARTTPANEVKAAIKRGAGPQTVFGQPLISKVSSAALGDKAHTVLRDLLLSLRAGEVADAAIRALAAGRKPVIGLEFTGGAALETLVDHLDLKDGDVLPTADFGRVLERLVRRTRDVKLTQAPTPKYPKGREFTHTLTDAELQAAGALSPYNMMLQAVQQFSAPEIPLSPIDAITNQITAAGYTVTEMTNRAWRLEQRGSELVLRTVKPTKRALQILDFQQHRADVAILNASAATGIDLHAVPSGHVTADQVRRREMIYAQLPSDINTFMQMSGRVLRHGQLSAPIYNFVLNNLPLERRPLARAMNKLRSLGAATAGGGIAMSVADAQPFTDKYGDQAARDVGKLTQFRPFSPLLLKPVKNTRGAPNTGITNSADFALKNLWKLPVAMQEAYLDALSSTYAANVAAAKKKGTYDVSLQTLDWRALTVKSEPLVTPDSTRGPFGGGVTLETLEVPSKFRAWNTARIVDVFTQRLGQKPFTAAADRVAKAQMRAALDARKAVDAATITDLTARATFEANFEANVAGPLLERGVFPGAMRHNTTSGYSEIVRSVVVAPMASSLTQVRVGTLTPHHEETRTVSPRSLDPLRLHANEAAVLHEFQQAHEANLGRETIRVLTGDALTATEKYLTGKDRIEGTVVQFTGADGQHRLGVRVTGGRLRARGQQVLTSVAAVLTALKTHERVTFGKSGVLRVDWRGQGEWTSLDPDLPYRISDLALRDIEALLNAQPAPYVLEAIAERIGTEWAAGQVYTETSVDLKAKRLSTGADGLGAALAAVSSEAREAIDGHYAGDTAKLTNDLVALADGRPTSASGLTRVALAVRKALRALLTALLSTTAVFSTAALTDTTLIEVRASTSVAVPASTLAPEKLAAMSQSGQHTLAAVINDLDFRTRTSFVADKPGGRVYVFDQGRYVADFPALYGAAVGDTGVPPTGTPLKQFRPADKITPAGRYVAEVADNDAMGRVIFLNGDAGDVAIHVNKSRVDARPERLASPSPEDNRITFGCIAIGADAWAAHVNTLPAGGSAAVFVAPEVAADVGKFFGLPAASRALRKQATPATNPDLKMKRLVPTQVAAAAKGWFERTDRPRTHAAYLSVAATGEAPRTMRASTLAGTITNSFLDHANEGMSLLRHAVEQVKGTAASAAKLAYAAVAREAILWRNKSDALFTRWRTDTVDAYARTLKSATAATKGGLTSEQLRRMANVYATARHALDRQRAIEARLNERLIDVDQVHQVAEFADAIGGSPLWAEYRKLVAEFTSMLNGRPSAKDVAGVFGRLDAVLTRIETHMTTDLAAQGYVGIEPPSFARMRQISRQHLRRAVKQRDIFKGLDALRDDLVWLDTLASKHDKLTKALDDAHSAVVAFHEANMSAPRKSKDAEGRDVEVLAFPLPGGLQRSTIDGVLAAVDTHPHADQIREVADSLVAGFRQLADIAVAEGIADADATTKLRVKYPNYVSLMGDSSRDVDDVVGVNRTRAYLDVSDGGGTVGQPNNPDVNMVAKLRQLSNAVGMRGLVEALGDLAAAKEMNDATEMVSAARLVRDAAELAGDTSAATTIIRAPATASRPAVDVAIMADSVRDALLRTPHLDNPIEQSIADATGVFGRLMTQATLAFGPVQLIREAASRTFNFAGVTDLSDAQVKKARGAFASALLKPALWGEVRELALHGRHTGTLSVLHDLGGLSTFTDARASEADLDALAARAATGRTGGVARAKEAVKEFFSRWNRLWEAAIPIATFQALQVAGMTPEAAAHRTLAMMNFRAKGTLTPRLNMLYPFFAANAQDIVQTVATLKTVRGQKDLMKLTALAMIAYTLAAGMDDEDELGNKFMDSAADSDLDGSLLIPTGGGDYVKVPIGFGSVRLAWVAGVRAARVMQGVDTPAEAVGTTAMAVIKMMPQGASDVNPTEDLASFLTATFTPGLVRPIVQLALNKDFAGQKITSALRDDQFASEQGRFATPELWKSMAEETRTWTGGLIDPAPEQLRHLAQGYMLGPLGAVLAFTRDAESTGGTAKPLREGATGFVAQATGIGRLYRDREPREALMSLADRYSAHALHTLKEVNARVPKTAERESLEQKIERAEQAGVVDNDLAILKAYLEWDQASGKAYRQRRVLQKAETRDMDALRDALLAEEDLMRSFIQAAGSN